MFFHSILLRKRDVLIIILHFRAPRETRQFTVLTQTHIMSHRLQHFLTTLDSVAIKFQMLKCLVPKSIHDQKIHIC